MALITNLGTWSSGTGYANATNKVVETALQVAYTKRRIYGNWSWTTGNMSHTETMAWEYVRRANKAYRYVGMDKTTAQTCANTLQALYNRTMQASRFDTDEGSPTFGQFVIESAGTALMADIAMRHVAGGMWEVTVNIREEDSRLLFISDGSYSTLFALEMARKYDTEGE